MESGKIEKQKGGEYRSVPDYAKCFKAFYHWLQKVERLRCVTLLDISEDVNTVQDENTFVYCEPELIEKMIPYFPIEEQVAIRVIKDILVRPPKELFNLKVSDIAPDYKEITIRAESSKTFERTVKILESSQALQEYVKLNNLKDDDYIFSFSYSMFNQRLKKVAVQLYGDRITRGGKRWGQFSMYDLRHIGACHLRKGYYKSKIDALMYRGGWTNLKMLNYYTKKIGMTDTIEENDLIIEADKSKVQKLEGEITSQAKLLKELQSQIFLLTQNSNVPVTIQEVTEGRLKASTIEALKKIIVSYDERGEDK